MPASPRQAAAVALVWVLPLYPLVPRLGIAGPLGADDFIPALTIGLAALAIASRSRDLGRRWRSLARDPVLVALIALLLVATVTSVARAGGLAEAGTALLRVTGRLSLYVVLVVAGRLLLDGRQRRQLLLVLVGVAVLEGAIGLAAYAGKLHGPWNTGMIAYPPELMPEGGRARVQGTFGGEVPAGETFLNRANFYSAYLALALMGLGAFLAEKRRRVVVLGAAALITGGILVSFSRMSLAAALAGGLVFASWRGRWRSVVIAAAVAGTIVLAAPPLRERFLSLETDRLGLWTIALRVIHEHPWLGTGDGRYLEEAERLGTGVDIPVVRGAHNSLLLAASTYGIGAGLALAALYTALLVGAVRRARTRRTPLAATRLAVVATFLVHDLTNSLFFVPEVALVFWALYAATAEGEGDLVDLGADRQLRRS